jgi:hypothetical protein
MFEARWLSCDDPEMMLRYMLGKTGDRKFRLFACACVRRIWHLLRDERSRSAIYMAEHYADRPGGHSQLLRSRTDAHLAEQYFDHLSRRGESREYDGARWAARAAEATVQDTGWDVARNAAWSAAHAVNVEAPQEQKAQCELLRDAFGNPFRLETFELSWMLWRDRCIERVAQTIYEERRFEELPILADALEEAGCENETILWHCRLPAEHARGCWVLDGILRKR